MWGCQKYKEQQKYCCFSRTVLQIEIAEWMDVTQELVSKTYSRFLELENRTNGPRRSRGNVTIAAQDRFNIYKQPDSYLSRNH